MLIGALVPTIAYKLHYYVENRFKIDDAVGSRYGARLWRFPRRGRCGLHAVGPTVLSFRRLCGHYAMGPLHRRLYHVRARLCAHAVCLLLNRMNLLRVPAAAEVQGLDFPTTEAYTLAVREIIAVERSMVK